MDAGTQPEAVVAGSLPADAPAGGELPEGDDSPLLLGAASKKQASREARLKIGIYSYRLVIAYDGTNYCGWQLQAGEVPTIQRTMEHVLTTITRKGTNRRLSHAALSCCLLLLPLLRGFPIHARFTDAVHLPTI